MDRLHWAKWYGDADPESCLGADRLYEQYVGVAPRRTPAALGVQLMDATMPRTMRRAPVEDWPAPALTGSTAYVEAWTVPLLGLENRAYLHAYDKNAQYLAACSSVELGLSGLRLIHAPTFDKRLPGYWWFGGAWHTTPALEWLRERHGYTMEPEQAYLWERHGRALTNWYERLRDARAALQGDATPAGRLALGAVKSTYAGAIGQLNAGWFRPNPREDRPGDLASPLFRPDWRHMIVDTARVNLARNVHEWGDVVAIYRDTVFIASDEPSAVEAAAGRLRFGANPGAWKVSGTWPLAPLAHTIDGGRISRLLRRIGELEHVA